MSFIKSVLNKNSKVNKQHVSNEKICLTKNEAIALKGIHESLQQIACSKISQESNKELIEATAKMLAKRFGRKITSRNVKSWVASVVSKPIFNSL